MALLRKYWVAALVLMLVVVHASILGYVRSQISRLKNVKSTTVEVGEFRFQPIHEPDQLYSFELHAVLAPRLRMQGEEMIGQYRIELQELIEQTLRQVDPVWLADPQQGELRQRLRDLIVERLNEPIVERMVITHFLKLPVHSGSVPADATHSPEPKDEQLTHST